ncbi:sensor histidine kinase [Paenarthrobacter sp. Z7-10]|uniref:sensor histidine kinase n=1 Tax=Paenarthrobacter sp. Z7-10 TaxID=2787635 RepID=UPI0022A9BBB9|nr:histidine kinase [Paenarthrobacter sp. Z7-10]MCZ2403095.1 sensor histidine kinase [Paenarthrobacter sp. Z7-10]
MAMHRIYDWFRRHAFVVDVSLMGLLLVFLLLVGLASSIGAAVLVTTVLLVVPLAWRRARTVPAGILVAAVALGQWAVGITPLAADVAVILMVYALAAYGPRWASLGGFVLALTGAVLLVSRFYARNNYPVLSVLSYGAVLVVLLWALVCFAWALGDLTRTRRLRLQALEDRTHRLEVEQQQERALAASDERSHIAREMHDIVAHSLSVIITQADGGRYAGAADPAVATATLATIADTGRASLQEMRRLLGVLRGGEEASTRPLPGLADIDDLLLSFRATGLELTFEQGGKPRRALPPGAELTAYRVVQEALTNVLKHAGPNATASASLRWQSRGLAIEVLDDGRGAAADSVAGGVHGGNGIRGMAERTKLYDGTLTARPRTGGGFQISAFIPYTEA